jgi:cytochrome oxidase assembly protein ShyY1
MSETSSKKLKFTPNWPASVLAILLLPLLVSLGFWQLDRADEKRQLQKLFAQRQVNGPLPIGQLFNKDDLRYQPVILRGEFINDKPLLLDNRIYKGQFGYEVIMPFQLESQNTIVLVNRGWLAGDKSRRTLPDIERLTGVVNLTAQVYVPQGEMLRLAVEENQGWPRVVQSVSIQDLAPEFEQAMFPYSVRLQEGSMASYSANWVVVNLQPSKHTGYAVQWFAMSITLLLIGVLANCNLWSIIKRNKNED